MKYSTKNKLPFIQDKVCSTHPLQTTQRWFSIFRSQFQFRFTKKTEKNTWQSLQILRTKKT